MKDTEQQTIDITLKVVTPLFISGADQQKAEVRESSIKGNLRFWFRATNPDYTEHEARIFGSADQNQGQGCFLLRIINRNSMPIVHSGDNRWSNSKITYLGYGVIERNKTERPYIKENSQIRLIIIFKPLRNNIKIHEYLQDINRVKKTLWLWLMFGGLGARSRKGFGSLVTIKASNMDDFPLKFADRNSLQTAVNQFIKENITPVKTTISSTGIDYPLFTRWSDKAQCKIIGKGATGEKALEWLGNNIHALRSHRGNKRLSFVGDDHDLIRDFIGFGKKPSAPPKRTAFGLPHNYFFSSLGDKKGDVNLKVDKDKKGRRGSPLFFSVYEFPNNSGACIIAILLPAKLIPPGKKVTLSSKGQADINLNLPDDYTAVTELLDNL